MKQNNDLAETKVPAFREDTGINQPNKSLNSDKPVEMDLVMDEIIDQACLLEIKDMKERLIQMAVGFTFKDLYNYEIKMNPTHFYRLLTECDAICQVFGLDEFSVHHFNLATQKLNYPKFAPSQLSKAYMPDAESDESPSSGEEVRVDESDTSNEDMSPSDVSTGQRIITLLTNVVAPVIVAFVAIALLKDYIDDYKDWYTPTIIGIIIMVSSTVTITSWHVKEFTFMRSLRTANKNPNDGK